MASLSQAVLLRVASIAPEELDVIRCPQGLAALRRAEQAQARLAQGREARCERLHRRVPLQPRGPLRKAVLDLKRAVHNDRLPEPVCSSLARDVEEDDLPGWRQELEDLHAALEEGERLLALWRSETAHLRALWRHELLRRGTFHAAPPLHAALERGFAAGRLPARAAEGLLMYAYRAATKTSPFGALTVTAVGRLSASASAPHAPRVDQLRAELVVDPRVVSAIALRWLADPDLVLRTPLRGPELVALDEEAVRFLVWSPSDGELLRSIERNPLVELGLRLADQHSSACSAADLRRRLATTLGCEPERASALLEGMRDCSLLRPELPHAVGRPWALRQLADAARAVGSDYHEGAERVSGALAELERATDARGSQHVRAVRAAVATLREAAGGEPTEAVADVVFDRCWAPAPVDLPAGALDAAGRDLDRLLGVLPLFNADLGLERIAQEALAELCVERPAVPLLDAFRAFAEAVDERGPIDCHPVAVEAERLRTSMVKELRELSQGGGAAAAEVPPAVLERWAQSARRFQPTRTGIGAAFLGQLADLAGSGLSLVLNGVAAGHGTLAAAWAREEGGDPASEWLLRTLRRELRELDDEGDVVEIAGGSAYGTQVRQALTGTVVRYPLDPPAPGERRVPCRDLVVRRDAQLGRIVLARGDGRRVLPLHVGPLSPHLLPPFYRFLTALGPAFTPDLSVIELLEREVPAAQLEAPRHYARLVVGDVVVSRRTWCVPATALPLSRGVHGSFGELLELRRWARELGLPRRVFVTATQTADVLRHGLPLREHRKSRKPFYLDFDDVGSCTLFRRLVRRHGPTVRFAEMLPTPEENPFDRAVECVLELRRSRG